MRPVLNRLARLSLGATLFAAPAPLLAQQASGALRWQPTGRIADRAVVPAAHDNAELPPAPTPALRRPAAAAASPKAPASSAAFGRGSNAVEGAPVERVAPAPTRVASRASGVLRAAGAAAAAQSMPHVVAAPEDVVTGDVEFAAPQYKAQQATCEMGGCGDPTCGDPLCGEPVCGDVVCGDAVWGDPACGCGDVGCGGECEPSCACSGDCTCGLRSLGGCAERGAIPIVLWVPPIHELTLHGGVHAFKGALDNDRDRGNFGFHEGVNAGGRMAWLPWWGLGYQLGYQATHNQLHGDTATASSESHTQQFVTGGLFHRKPVGLQYGVVYDWMQDERQGTADFGQVRGLLSIRGPRAGEFGFTFTHGTNTQRLRGADYEALDQYLLFYRAHGPQGGDFRLMAGLDEESRGVLGADASLPLNNRWSIDTGFRYLIADNSVSGSGGAEEAWNLGINLVWHYGKRAKTSFRSPFRPMFGVADNGSMIVDDLD
ncbi:MAG: DUF6666 family protein [Lacipirellulaceae bacterium]